MSVPMEPGQGGQVRPMTPKCLPALACEHSTCRGNAVALLLFPKRIQIPLTQNPAGILGKQVPHEQVDTIHVCICESL